jgi:hypothetical protein
LQTSKRGDVGNPHPIPTCIAGIARQSQLLTTLVVTFPDSVPGDGQKPRERAAQLLLSGVLHSTKFHW